MTGVFHVTSGDVLPDRATVLEHQGVPRDRSVSAGVEALLDSAMRLYADLAHPVGAIEEMDKLAFAGVYDGQGQNETDTPVGDVFPLASRLAIFAVTLGQPIQQAIADRFGSNDPALGCMLDSVASGAADKLAEHAQQRYFEDIRDGRPNPTDVSALRYSPGYCGWHISGQKKLLASLGADRIGITLGASFLMDPLKSVSGVVLVGPRGIHDFDAAYSFCSSCEARGCRERIRSLDAR